MVKVKDIVGLGPKQPEKAHVDFIVEQVQAKQELRDNFFQNFEGLASQLEQQSRQGRGSATQAMRDECAWQAANVRRFVAAVRKRLGG
jgi:hypothetical protein